MGISLLSNKTTTQMDLIQQSPSKEMEISAAKVNAVLQESPFRVSFPSSHLPSQSQDTEQAVQTTEHHSDRQSVVEPEHSRQAHAHNSPSLTSSALPGVNSQGKEISPCATTPSSCQEQRNTQIPSYSNCIATRKKSAELHYLTPMAHRSSI